ncbi:HAD-IIB family hydrolase [Halioxenophilus sp. WMMB6]|uniref:HAD-IIB family hydrolase n=1 Tax=Halioxenophilus sp. WMMB6 TaxID=3073815 RepID=UPI00295E7872|nr:HAD-IIB family hydrolase [Halioxenophilus sp. WMMB6]
MSQLLIFTDMDGTLLDHHTYSHQAADPLLAELSRRSIPVIPCTSKTFAELVELRSELQNREPFIVENGAAVYIPTGYFSAQPKDTDCVAGYWRKAFVEPRQYWCSLLDDVGKQFSEYFDSYSELGVAGIARLTGLSEAEAERSAQRQFGEPVHWHGPPEVKADFVQALQAAGAQVLIGGRFIHISGAVDKGQALLWLSHCYQRHSHASVTTVGLGDSGNDVAMLNVVDNPIIVRSPVHEPPAVTPAAVANSLIITKATGPQGWVEGVTLVLSRQCGSV